MYKAKGCLRCRSGKAFYTRDYDQIIIDGRDIELISTKIECGKMTLFADLQFCPWCGERITLRKGGAE